MLKSSARPEYFSIPSYTANALIKAAGRAQLVQAEPASAAAAHAAAGKPAGGKPDSPRESSGFWISRISRDKIIS